MTAAPIPPPEHGAARDSYAVLRVPAFRWFIASTFAGTLAMQIQAVVTAWLVYALTHDALMLGLIGLAEALPFIGVALFAGHVADLVDRRRVAIAALSVLVGCSVALLAISIRLAGIAAPDRRAALPIYLVIAVSGVARSFLQPSRSALAAELVPRALYERAAAWRSSAWQLAAVAGPALGGLLYGFGSARLAYAVDATLVVAALVCMWLVRRVRIVTPPAALRDGLRESLGTGIRFLRSQPIVLGALSLDLFSVLFGGATALLPIFASDILHVGPQGLGILQSAPAAGAVVTSLALAHRPPLQRAGRALFIAVVIFGLATIGFALSRSFWLSLAMLVVTGMADTVSVVIRSTLLQVFTPVELLGRVSAVNQIFIGSSNEIGAFESGVTAKLMGAVGSVLFGGTMTLIVVTLTAWRVPQLRRLKAIRP